MTTSDVAVGTPPRWPVQWPVAGAGLAILLAGALLLGADGWRSGILFLIGGLLGVTLYHAAFGFTAAYRRAVVERDVSGILAQLVMLGAAMLLFAPILAQGEAFGRGAPVGVQVAVGSFLFGLGMQLGGGGGSGTLYTVGGGSSRMLVTLVAFCAGAFWGSLDMSFWASMPGWGSLSLARSFGWETAIPLQLAFLATIWIAFRVYARGKPQRSLWDRPAGWRQYVTGPWPLLMGAAMLALLNWLTLLVAGHPWSITWAFTLWGAKASAALGWDAATSPFWTAPFQKAALAQSVFRDVTSIMDMGIVAGALAAAVIGGLLMGSGARLAFGCNIGAFFSGVASGSLHGWLWIACALPGTWLGVKLRPLFGLRI